ncbi:rod shape determining protein RodA [Sphingomonas kaistensis]|uniref:Peptidoglycan glycosyltransferase MrdB n=1 Tax=Sphingomonas kaistensis TaxID=298708 RepID=A0A7X6BH05_9SPHN|nr:rod shape-determining protein RodA [Sphingomonas kaistensis]NJC06443.1 rod shape determining protein RodA [Sphingomonas kaistensis]
MISSAIIPQPLARLPWRLIFLVLGIGLFGLINLYSAAGGSIEPWALRQGMAFGFFLTVAIFISKVREATVKQITFPVYGAIVIMLILVDLLGFVGKGAQRWLDLGFIRLQPSEFMKPAIALTLARFYELLPAGEIRKFRAVWPAALLLGIPAALVILQPDLGTGLMVTFAGVTVMFLAGVPLRWFLVPGLTIAAAIPIVYQFLHGYQRKRIDIFLDPESDPLGAGYHITQSKIAIGSGGMFGKGYLQGSQSHLQYLPEGHTDFAFATLAEEWGMFGGTVLIVAYLLMLRWCLKVAANAPTRFARLSCAGLTAVLFSYFAINLLMVMGMAPVVGIPLPLISYGGSAVMTVMICLGLLMSFERQQRTSSRLS